MFNLPHSSIPGAVFPAVPAKAAATMLAVLHQFRVTERLPPAELQALQFRQLGELLAHASRTVPYYEPILRVAGFRPGEPLTAEAWARLPVLTRVQVQEAGDRLHARELPAGHGAVATATTSGSSGRPVTIRKSALYQFYWQCLVVRDHEWQARDFGATWMALLRDSERDAAKQGPLRRMANWGGPLPAIYPTGPGLFLDYRAPVAELLANIISERPAYLVTFPSLLRELLCEGQATGRRPQGLREVRTTGEALSLELRDLAIAAWSEAGRPPLRVTEAYSSAEFGAIAIPCLEHNALHVQAEGVHLEILRPDGSPCDIGEEGQVVLTSLHNFAMPLIRYEITDRAILGTPCACGRTLPVLAAIPGRARDMLTLPDGQRRFPFYGHRTIMKDDAIMSAIVQQQAVQTALDEVEIRLVVRRPLTAAEEKFIIDTATTALGGAHWVRLAYRSEIPRGPGGKFAEFTNEYENPPAGK
jgi:phenylacetate-CoA ligase